MLEMVLPVCHVDLVVSAARGGGLGNLCMGCDCIRCFSYHLFVRGTDKGGGSIVCGGSTSSSAPPAKIRRLEVAPDAFDCPVCFEACNVARFSSTFLMGGPSRTLDLPRCFSSFLTSPPFLPSRPSLSLSLLAASCPTGLVIIHVFKNNTLHCSNTFTHQRYTTGFYRDTGETQKTSRRSHGNTILLKSWGQRASGQG